MDRANAAAGAQSGVNWNAADYAAVQRVEQRAAQAAAEAAALAAREQATEAREFSARVAEQAALQAEAPAARAADALESIEDQFNTLGFLGLGRGRVRRMTERSFFPR